MKLCVMCKHFNMDGGHAYSEYTVDPASVGCAKMHWTIYNADDTTEFRKEIKRAETCKDYDDAD